MPARKNLVVAQSGGPSPVINNTLRGIIEACRDLDTIGTVYAARHGIEGVLKEELLDLSAQSVDEVSLLRYTPAAGSIGTCRYKLKPNQQEDFERCIEVFRRTTSATSSTSAATIRWIRRTRSPIWPIARLDLTGIAAPRRSTMTWGTVNSS